MLKFPKQSRSGESGSITTTNIVIMTGVALATSAVLTVNHSLKKNRESTDQSSTERRLNESAIQAVTQLITNGALHYSETCKRIEPTAPNSEYEFKAASDCSIITNKVRPKPDCKSNDDLASKWVYSLDASGKLASIQVCVRSSEKVKGKLETAGKLVTVTFTKEPKKRDDDGKNERYYVDVKSQPDGNNARGIKYATLNGRISLGLAEGNTGLIGKHGAADTCFYMRPVSTKQSRNSKNLAFNARAKTGAYDFTELEPRPDGPNADEFQQSVDVGTKAPEDYEILAEYRDNLIKEFYNANNYRGNRPKTENWNNSPSPSRPDDGRSRYVAEVLTATNFVQHTGKQFLGVMPNIPNGPKFQYFLAARPGTSDHLHGSQWTVFDPRYVEYYRQGCATSAVDGSATFCTKVEIPLKQYKAAMNNKCKSYPRGLQNVSYDQVPTKAYSNRAIQTSCSPKWVEKVQKLLEEEKKNLTGMALPTNETTATMAMSALEVDDDFLQRTGKWAQQPNHRIRAAYDEFASELLAGADSGMKILDAYTIEYQSDKDVAHEETDDKGNTKLVYDYKGKDREWNVYAIETMDGAKIAEKFHESKSCAYFKYYNPTSPKTCSIGYVTKDEKGYVCRNNDGCFDELTKIRMADGSERLVTQLRKGEFVYNPVTRKPAKIVKLTMGPELKPLFHVTIGTSTVRVTDSHPFMTPKGWVQARNLRLGDKILSEGKQYLEVRKVELGEPGRTVANLALEGPANVPELHYVLADGVVTGDLVIQNMLESKASAAGHHSQR